MSREEALAYAANHQVMTLATAGPDGVWAAAVFYVSEVFDFYFLSAAHTRHARHIDRNPEVAATIQEDYAGWEEIRGIQMEGSVQLLEGDDRADAIRRYRSKYPFLAGASGAIKAALARVNWYRLRPRHLYFVDNSKGFGHRDQIF